VFGNLFADFKFIDTQKLDYLLEMSESLVDLNSAIDLLLSSKFVLSNEQMKQMIAKIIDLHEKNITVTAPNQAKINVVEKCFRLCQSTESLKYLKACFEIIGNSWPDFISSKISAVLNLPYVDDMFDQLVVTHDYEALEMLSEKMQDNAHYLLLNKLIFAACKRGEMKVLKNLYSNFATEFIDIIKEPKNVQFKPFIDECINQNFPDRFKYISQFTGPMGEIDYLGGLVCCAAIAKKSKDFRPVLLNCSESLEELIDLFNFIEKNKNKLDAELIRFVLTGIHWISGVIQIKHGKINILFIDPLGKGSFDSGALFSDQKINLAQLAENHLSNINCWVIETKRQHDSSGCSVFVLDDARKLFKTDDFFTVLPLKMLRTTQSLSTIKALGSLSHYSNDLNVPINKRGKSFLESLKENIENVGGKPVNKRLEHKFGQLSIKVWDFLISHNDEELSKSMNKFTLANFKEAELTKAKDNALKNKLLD